MFLIIYKLNSLLNMLHMFLLSSIWEGDGQGIMDFYSLTTTERQSARRANQGAFSSSFSDSFWQEGDPQGQEHVTTILMTSPHFKGLIVALEPPLRDTIG